VLFFSILFRPSEGWDRLRAADAPWTRPLLRHALPAALVLAIAWPIAQAANGTPPSGLGRLAADAARVVLLSLAAVMALASGFHVLGPLFRVRRHWSRAVAVAAYAATPAFLAGALFAIPFLAVLGMVAFLHCFGLSYLGVQQVLGCRESDAMGYAVAAWCFGGLATMLLGGLCSAAGVL
jgi:hypothetical protein